MYLVYMERFFAIEILKLTRYFCDIINVNVSWYFYYQNYLVLNKLSNLILKSNLLTYGQDFVCSFFFYKFKQ